MSDGESNEGGVEREAFGEGVKFAVVGEGGVVGCCEGVGGEGTEGGEEGGEGADGGEVVVRGGGGGGG